MANAPASKAPPAPAKAGAKYGAAMAKAATPKVAQPPGMALCTDLSN